MTERQHAVLRDHLFPGDGKEAVAVALCGVAKGTVDRHDMTLLMVHQIELIPHSECTVRTSERVSWPTDRLPALLQLAQKRGFRLLKIHSHPNGYRDFSRFDDEADRELFAGVAGWLLTARPGVSAIMLPDGRVIARDVNDEGAFTPVPRVTVVGDDIRFFDRAEAEGAVPAFAERTAQAFGAGTTQLLRRLQVGVVGASGTGSPVVEMLARLGLGGLVLVDPDRTEYRNLNRIFNATSEDAALGRQKVTVLGGAVGRMGLGTRVEAISGSVFDPAVVARLAQCDILFGCVDAVDARDLLNRLAVHYTIPYLDIGVRLEADGQGGVDQVCGGVHYLQPDGSSLLSRRAFTHKQVEAAGLRRTDPAEYERRRKEKYIVGVDEDRPAVVSVNTLFAALAVNELLARLHSYRDDPSRDYAWVSMSLSQMRLIQEAEGKACPALAKDAGRGDRNPVLGMPELSL